MRSAVGRAFTGRGLRPGHILTDGTIEPHAATEERLLAWASEKEADLFQAPTRSLADAYRLRARAIAARIKQ